MVHTDAGVMNADHQIHLVILLRNLLYKRTHFSFVFRIIKYILNPYYHKNWNLYLYNNANQSTIVVIDDLLHGILQLQLTFIIHGGDLTAHTVLHQFTNRLTKDIGLKDTFLGLLSLLDIVDQILRLLFTADDRRDLCLNVGTDHMNGRR